MYRIIALEGPPASGKGTVAARLLEVYGFKPISLGDYFRTHTNDPRCQQASIYSRRGKFAPDSLIIPMMLEVLETAKASGVQTLTLDGMPRTLAQGQAAYQWAKDNNVEFIFMRLVLPDSEPDKRRQARVAEMQAQGKTIRDDDKPEIFTERMAEYRSHTAPLRDFFQSENVLMEIPALGSKDEVFGRIRRALAAEGILPVRRIKVPKNGILPPSP